MIIYIKILDIFVNFNNSETVIKNNNELIDNKKDIKILTYNIDGLFCHYDINIIKKLIIDLQELMERDIDIICFQEVWHYNLRNKIIDFAKDKLWNVAIPSNKKRYFIGENSGLLTLSKFPIIYQKIHTFEIRRAACALTHKSAQYLTIQINVNNNINIVNTHLQSSHLNYCQNFKKIALKQMKEIIKFSPFENFILMGDLNIDYDYLKKNLNIYLNFFKNYEFHITYPDSEEHLDHFLYKGKEYNFTNTISRLDIDSSDHFPLLMKINLT